MFTAKRPTTEGKGGREGEIQRKVVMSPGEGLESEVKWVTGKKERKETRLAGRKENEVKWKTEKKRRQEKKEKNDKAMEKTEDKTKEEKKEGEKRDKDRRKERKEVNPSVIMRERKSHRRKVKARIHEER